MRSDFLIDLRLNWIEFMGYPPLDRFLISYISQKKSARIWTLYKFILLKSF